MCFSMKRKLSLKEKLCYMHMIINKDLNIIFYTGTVDEEGEDRVTEVG